MTERELKEEKDAIDLIDKAVNLTFLRSTERRGDRNQQAEDQDRKHDDANRYTCAHL
jgi:hypothetical protein